jgi:hypothetical protein
MSRDDFSRRKKIRVRGIRLRSCMPLLCNRHICEMVNPVASKVLTLDNQFFLAS